MLCFSSFYKQKRNNQFDRNKKRKHMKSNFFKWTFFAVFFVIAFNSCSLEDDYEEGKIPKTPVNIEDANSEFDDYNMASPYYLYRQFSMLFSSNRKTSGGTFDFVNYIAEYYYGESSNTFSFVVDTSRHYYLYDSALVKINSEFNEYGPMIIPSSDNMYYVFLFASDKTGDLDIYYSEVHVSDYLWDNPVSLQKFNTASNDAYPALGRSYKEIFFCSDSTGNYDIYKVTAPDGVSFMNWIRMDANPEKIACTELNSNADDKCPYINGNLMVFASNRDGGYGGYDLYYSEYKNNSWSAPVNFGSEINSEYDEYRPVAMYAYQYKNDLMIFSSNRPGGKGGFDLYYVGIPKMID